MAVATARGVHGTPEEYTAFENESSSKHEFLDGEVLAIARARPQHSELASAVCTRLNMLTRSRGCRAFDSDQRMLIRETGLYTYADGGLRCGERRLSADGMCLLNPVVVFEVLSPGTRDYDLGAKRGHLSTHPFLAPSDPIRSAECLRLAQLARQPGPLGRA
jgi:Uma2 family endonuclease